MKYIEICEANTPILLLIMILAFLVIGTITMILERKEEKKTKQAKTTQKREIKRRLSKEEFNKKYNHKL